MTTVDFFLASPCGNGFFSLFPEVSKLSDNSTVNILCSSSAEGKQKVLTDAIDSACEDAIVERIHCARNTDTLDGVIIHQSGTSAVTAAAGKMHKLYPRYPGVGENIIVIADDKANRAAELEKHIEIASGLEAACGFLQAAARFDVDTRNIAAKYVNFAKLDKAAGKIAAALYGSKKGKGEVNRRLVSAITKEGVVTLETAWTAFCDEVYVMKDDYGVVADRICRIIAAKAVDTVYVCLNPLNPDFIDHVILPGKKLGFIRQTKEWQTDFYPFKVISQQRFCSLSPESKVQINFNKKAKKEMLDVAISKL
jgi:hypothetical protein